MIDQVPNFPSASEADKANLLMEMHAFPGWRAAMKAIQRIHDSRMVWSQQLKFIKEAMGFYGGDQWAPADKIRLRDEKRIPVVFNFSAKHIDSIVGAEIHNRQETRFVPRNTDPQTLPTMSALGELETSVYQWVMDSCNGEEEVSTAFSDMNKSGMGWVEVFVDRDTYEDTHIIVRRIDPLEMMWDGQARMQNLEDARWVARQKLVPLDEAVEMWPDREFELRAMANNAAGINLGFTKDEEIEEITPLMYEEGRINVSPGELAGKKGMVPVIHYQWWELENVHEVKDPQTGETKEYTDRDFKTLNKRLSQLGHHLRGVERTKKVFKEIFIAASSLPLTEAEEVPVEHCGFSFKCMTGKWDSHKRVWRGLLYNLMDPQRYVNKWLSQCIHIINSNPKGGIIAEATAFKDPTTVELDWARPDSIILCEEGALSGQNPKIEIRPLGQPPAASFQMMQFCIDALTGVAGISPEQLAQAEGGDLPAMTMRQRLQQGMQVNAIYFYALTRFRKNLARTVLEYAREFIADGRVVRIGGPFDAKTMQLFRKAISPEYDVVIDQTIRNPNAKAEVWASLGPLMPAILRYGAMVPEIMDLVPGLPESIAVKIKARIQQAMQSGNMPGKQQGKGKGAIGPSPMEQQGKAMESQAKARLSAAKAAETMAKARNLDRVTQIKKAVALADIAAKHHRANTARLQAHHQHESNMQRLVMDSIRREGRQRPER